MTIFQPQRGSVDLDLEQHYISNLPTNVKEEVLMKLPIKEAVRTSLLSTKWKNAWMLIPNLVFKEYCAKSKLIRLVDRVLLLHCGPILQFKLVSRFACNEAIGRWILILSRNGIKNLYIELGYVEKYKIPSSFFSCLALEHVHIVCGIIHFPCFLQGFKFLRTLRLVLCKLTGTVARFISSCPLLESLELSDLVEFGRLVIHAPNLRWLSITGEFGDLCLETPKVRFADINLEDNLGYYHTFSLPSEDCESNILRVLGSLYAIEELDLCFDFISVRDPYLRKVPINYLNVFSQGAHTRSAPCTLLPIDTAVYRPLCTYKEDIAAAFCLFKSAPNLKVLSFTLYSEEESYPSPSLAQSFWEVKGIESNMFNCLQIVKIFYFEYPESILNVAKFVLSTAPVLEKLVISERNVDNLMDGMAFLKKLASFPRLSKMAKIVFVYDIL